MSSFASQSSSSAAAVQFVELPPRLSSTEDLFHYVKRVSCSESLDFRTSPPSSVLFRKVLGYANPYKHGDETLSVASPSASSRSVARELIGGTTVRDIDQYPAHRDQLYELCCEVDERVRESVKDCTISDLKFHLLSSPEPKSVLPGLTSDVIACIVKTCTDDELKQIGGRVFNVLPGSKLGSPGYFGARVQPNSPTDDPSDIEMQCLNAFSYAVGDVMLGCNPVSSSPSSVHSIELRLKGVIEAFDLGETLPHCVLAHVDVQAEVERLHPGSTALFFQSIAGSDDANQTFDLPVGRMVSHAEKRNGRFGLYLETGQGADLTNGHANGLDMVFWDSRKYGFARALRRRVADASGTEGHVLINDVSGFIGPEVFRDKHQLLRCCLEDTVLGKLHGLTIGLDVCSTLHMDVTIEDLDWCLDELMPAQPAWCMALPTKNDPMLSYLTTSFQDHVRIRTKFGRKVDDRMWDFFVDVLQVVERDGTPTKNFGDPSWVYALFMEKKGDVRTRGELRAEADAIIADMKKRGVPVARGFGKEPWELEPELDKYVRGLYDDAKTTLWHEFADEFVDTIPNVVRLETRSLDRRDYVWHPVSGERLSERSEEVLMTRVRADSDWKADKPVLTVIVSDGLCSDAISDHGHLAPFLERLFEVLASDGEFDVCNEVYCVRSGRVRAGYHAGELLYGWGDESGGAQPPPPHWSKGGAAAAAAAAKCVGGVVHIIGERPGSGHRTFSAYLTVATRETWATARKVDHDITRVVCGIADTSYDPRAAADECCAILKTLKDTKGVSTHCAGDAAERATNNKTVVTNRSRSSRSSRSSRTGSQDEAGDSD